jgi:NNP family nitrate/nitrite transporter-like MFS transporter
VSRFFIGILGGSFVPCQVWSTGFFDKNIVGTANAFTGGFGNAGGGITYFIMPAVFDSFRRHGHTAGQAWRLTFIVPLIMVIFTAFSLLFLCPDTPVGKWNERHLHVQENLQFHGVAADPIVDVPGGITEKAIPSDSHASDMEDKREKPPTFDHEAPLTKSEMLETAQGEVIQKPTFKEALHVMFSPQTAFHFCTYFCSFGAELAVNAILSSYYLKNFPHLGQTNAANWAAMFGFLNFVTRPLGGIISDLMYNLGGRNLWLKKGWITTCGILTGIILVIIGQVNPHSQSTMYGLIALMAIFVEAGNGANFALVPHVHPFANGILSGVTGAGGNLGGVVFAIIFRFTDAGTNYAKALWVIGVIHIGMNLAVCWIRPLPKGQIGGH